MRKIRCRGIFNKIHDGETTGPGSGDPPQEIGIAYDTIYDNLTAEERRTRSHNLEADGSIRHRNANLEMPNGWETDAYLLGFSYPEGADPNDPDAIIRTMVIDSNYLRRDGKVVLDPLSKVYLTMTRRLAERTPERSACHPCFDSIRDKTSKRPLERQTCRIQL
ncbi:hypothetical protein Q31b_54500 [Novipirellula aureliae]|uniref:Uncharacterized protein n=1 Tax=Novipirellula aureliae TaxID=2527966 RepID=A0A5C6DH65_9BACT|nr:hypothetical protein [Novipirellula aureliae]TWU35354.1 hypothetical protein Q31b_54500 [Novipirellula aureliae]